MDGPWLFLIGGGETDHRPVVLPLGGVAVAAPALADLADLEAVQHVGVGAGGIVARGLRRPMGRLCDGVQL